MPRIKLRAWDKVQQHFVYFEIGVIDGKMWTTPPIYPDHNLSDWMRYTGFLDKYGNEVCEGDIVRIDEVGLCRVDYLPHSMKFFFETLKKSDKQFSVISEGVEIVGDIINYKVDAKDL